VFKVVKNMWRKWVLQQDGELDKAEERGEGEDLGRRDKRGHSRSRDVT
jgi:hypothetical protein